MIANPNLIFYACIARGPIILAEISSSKEPGIEVIAQRCIRITPSHHSLFSHTAHKRTYTYLINDPFAYFAIFHAWMVKSESIWFLNRVKNAFEEFFASNSIVDFEKLTPLCFQGDFDPIFRQIVARDLEEVNSLEEEAKDDQNPSLDSSSRDSTRGKKAAVKPFLSKPSKVWFKKKKRLLNGFWEEANGDHHHHVKDGDCDCEEDAIKGSNLDESKSVAASKDFAVSTMHKSGGVYLVDDRKRAKQIWRKHVWVVLILDLIICAALFGIWLWVCRGFQCIDG
uniref:Uncharacterized protein MANES_01G184100 n=1 Tax=Rhizophora mucronata TaxID=61149 RepID=A0A2P2IV43_RHIMU